MMKNCGTCKWWDHTKKIDVGVTSIKFKSGCVCPLPDLSDAVLESTRFEKSWAMLEDEGAECQTYEARD